MSQYSINSYHLLSSLSTGLIFAFSLTLNLINSHLQSQPKPNTGVAVAAAILLLLFSAGSHWSGMIAYRIKERIKAMMFLERKLHLFDQVLRAPGDWLSDERNAPEKLSGRITEDVETCTTYLFEKKIRTRNLAFFLVFYLLFLCILFLRPDLFALTTTQDVLNTQKVSDIFDMRRTLPLSITLGTTLFISIAVPVALYAIFRLLTRFRKFETDELVDRRANERESLLHSLRGIHEIRSANAYEIAEDSFRTKLLAVNRVRAKLARDYSYTFNAGEFVTAFIQAAFVSLLLMKYMNSAATAISFMVSFMFIGKEYAKRLSDFFDLSVMKKKQNYASLRLAEIENIGIPSRTSEISTLSCHDLSLRSVTVANPQRADSLEPFSRKNLINDITLTIPAGMHIGLIGPTGSGKSTLLKAIAQQASVSNGGQILIDGKPLDSLPFEHGLGRIGFVAQKPFLFKTSIRDNILLGATRESITDGDLLQAIDSVGLTPFLSVYAEGYPNPLDANLLQEGRSVSAGECMKIAIARAIVRKPDIFLFDEITSPLDETSTRQIIGIIDTALKGKTVLFVSHRPSILKSMDRIVVMNNGQITDDGTYDALMKRPGLFAKMLAVETGRETDMSKLTQLEIEATPEGVLESLTNSRLFASLNWTSAAKIAKSAKIEEHHAGEVLFRKGDPGEYIYSILSGELSIHDQTFKAGDTFGEIAVFSNSRRTADVVCKSDCVLAAIHKDDILELCEKEPSTTLLILQATAKIAERESRRHETSTSG